MEPVFNWRPVQSRQALTKLGVSYLTLRDGTVGLNKHAAMSINFDPMVEVDEINKALRLRKPEPGEAGYSVSRSPRRNGTTVGFSCKTGLPNGRYVSLLDPYIFVLEKTPMLPHTIATVPKKG